MHNIGKVGQRSATFNQKRPRFSAHWVEETDRMRRYCDDYQSALHELDSLSIDQLAILEDAARQKRIMKSQGRQNWTIIPFIAPANMLDNLGNSFVSAVHQFARALPAGMRFPFVSLITEYVEGVQG